jgi:hypothetical protein
MDQLDAIDQREDPGDGLGADHQLLINADIKWSKNFGLELLDVALAQFSIESAAAVEHQLAPGEALAILLDQSLYDLPAILCRLQEWGHALLLG